MPRGTRIDNVSGMRVCPVCEHQQIQGEVCDNCGKQLALTPVQPVATAPLPELERTRLASAEVAAAPAQMMPELELTSFRSGPELPARPERPSLVCNYVASTSGQCFETVSEACKAMGCPEDECGTLYGSAPSGPLRLACN